MLFSEAGKVSTEDLSTSDGMGGEHVEEKGPTAVRTGLPLG